MQVRAGQGVYYKDHTIINTVRPSTAAQNPALYMPSAIISWNMPDRLRRVMYCLNLQKPYCTVEDARTVALEEAKAWVDHHILT